MMFMCYVIIYVHRLEEEERSRQKLQLDRVAADGKLKKMDERFAILDDANAKVQQNKC